MRVGIITLALENNYGGILQNFALQYILRQMGHEPMTCRWKTYTNLGFCKAFLISILKGGKDFPTIPRVYHRNRRGLEDFIRKNISYKYYRNPRKFFNWFKPEAMIVGSDQVWRPKYNSHLYSAFLDFVSDTSIKRIAYAASFGVGEWEYSAEQEKICRELIGRFDAVSVREQSGVNLCNEHFDVDAQCVLDPTLLVPRGVYESLCADIPQKDEFILVYMVDYSIKIKEEAEKLSRETSLPIIVIEADKGVTPEDSVSKWLAAFRDAKYVITDSFHGTVFSIIFEKNFVAVGNERRGVDRFVSLLDSLQLVDSFVNESNLNEIVEKILKEDKYSLINRMRYQMTIEGISFINSALNLNLV